MNTMSVGIVVGVTVLVISLNGVAATSTSAPDQAATTQVTEESTLPEDVRGKVDEVLDNLMVAFDTDQADSLLNIAPHEELIPYLIQVLGDEERNWHARQKAALTLATDGDPRGATICLQLIHKYLRPRKDLLSHAESEVLYSCIGSLPWYGTDEGVDEAFKMLMVEYWSGPDLPVPEVAQKNGEDTVQSYRDAALLGLSHAGTDRAVKAFETGEGIPQDLLARNKGAMTEFLENAHKAREKRQRNTPAAKRTEQSVPLSESK